MPVGDRVRLQRLLRKRGSSSAEDDEQDPPLGRKKTICSVQGVRHVCYTRHTQAVLCWMSAICFGCYAVFGQCVPQSQPLNSVTAGACSCVCRCRCRCRCRVLSQPHRRGEDTTRSTPLCPRSATGTR